MKHQQNILLFGGACFFGAYIYFQNVPVTKEINWQEFRSNYLGKGEVDRVVIVDRNTANVFLKSNPQEVINLLEWRWGVVEINRFNFNKSKFCHKT